MLRSRLDRAFVRYARTGDPGALARVFDGCAAELYRIGFHLLGDRHAAEDLVQQTFVVAIEQAKSFEGERRVLPWLCGILTNRALHLRRQRRRPASPAAGRDDVVDPIAEAAQHELSERVAATVRTLPEPYRQVLLLHLVHELAPKDVAEALSRPDATVRTQLARGLELLRKALPVGIAGFAAGQVPLPLGLAAVRAVVMAKAGTAAAAGAVGAGASAGFAVGGITVTGVLAMKKVLVAVVVLTVMLGSWVWWGGDPTLPAAVDAGSKPVANATAQQAPVATASTPAPSTDPQRIAAPPSHDPHTSSLELLVLWPDGAPATDIAVRVRPRPFDLEAWMRSSRTGDDGIARLHGMPPGIANALTDRGASVDVELTAGTVQSATVTLDRGLDVLGRVVDLDGMPFAGAKVWLSVVPDSDDSEPVATSAVDGTFAIRGACRGHVVSATAPGFATAKVARVERPELVMTMRPAPGVLTGIVLDAAGQPVVDARLLLGLVMGGRSQAGVQQRLLGTINGRDHWPARFLRTDGEGRFRSEGLPSWKWPLWVCAAGHAMSLREVQVLDAGETAVTVQLAVGATLRARIVDGAGAAVVGATVSAFAKLPSLDTRFTLGIEQLLSPPPWWRTRTTSEADGSVELRCLAPGPTTLAAWRESATARRECDLVDGETFVWDAVLAPREQQRLHGVLVDGAGKPLEGWRLRMGEVGGSQAPFRMWTIEGGRFSRSGWGANETSRRHRIFAAPPHTMVGTEVDLGEFDIADGPLRLVVPSAQTPTARIRGRIVMPAGAVPSRWFVSAVFAGSRDSARVACDDEGRYVAGPVRAGTYLLKAECPAFGVVAIGTVSVIDGRDTDAGTFTPPVPGVLVVTMVDATGKRLPDAWVDARAVVGGAELDVYLEHCDGVARGNLCAGRWRLTTRDRTTLTAIDVDVRAGETTDVRFVIPAGVPFVLRTPDAARSSQVRLRWLADGQLLRESDTPVEIELGKDLPLSAPAGRYSLEAIDPDGKKATTTFDLRGTDPPMVVELPLPPQ